MALSANSALHAATKNIISAAGSPNPLEQVKTVLREITDRFHASGVLIHEEDDDEVLLHATQNLTIYHITLSPGLQYPPHNHLMDALIGIYKGGETNFIYPVAAGGKLEVPERRDSVAPALVHLPRRPCIQSLTPAAHAQEHFMCISATSHGPVENFGISKAIKPSHLTTSAIWPAPSPFQKVDRK